jgi:Uma2 family endonuclease
MQAQDKIQVSRRRFTVHDYHRMAEAGILHEDDRVELIEGEITDMTPIGARHAMCVVKLNSQLAKAVGDENLVSPQNPIRLNEGSEPQPDLAVIRARDYRESLPGPEDALLLIEVADTSLAYDREVKLPLYARHGIREVWIVDLANEVVERHTEPSGSGYRFIRRAGRGEAVESGALNELSVKVNDILG